MTDITNPNREQARELVEREAISLIEDVIGTRYSGTVQRVVEDHLRQFARGLAALPTPEADDLSDNDRAELASLQKAWRDAKRTGLRKLTFGLWSPTSEAERVEIPAGMVPWHGGDSAPADWDREWVQLRGGRTIFANGSAIDWSTTDGPYAVIAYTPRPTNDPAGSAGESGMQNYSDLAAALRNTPAEALREAGYLDRVAGLLDWLCQREMAAFGASDAACYLYPRIDQAKERAAFCDGAAHNVLHPTQDSRDVAGAEDSRTFAIGQRVEKISGSSWRGKVVGTYSTALTPEGYAVESENEPGSVQIYPAKALRAALDLHTTEGEA